MDLVALIEGKSREEAEQTHLRTGRQRNRRDPSGLEARYLRSKVLKEIGLDSLMAMELGMSFRQNTGFDMPLQRCRRARRSATSRASSITRLPSTPTWAKRGQGSGRQVGRPVSRNGTPTPVKAEPCNERRSEVTASQRCPSGSRTSLNCMKDHARPATRNRKARPERAVPPRLQPATAFRGPAGIQAGPDASSGQRTARHRQSVLPQRMPARPVPRR